MRRFKYLIQLAVSAFTFVIAFGLISLGEQASAASFTHAGDGSLASSRILPATDRQDLFPIAVDDFDSTDEDIVVETDVTANDLLVNNGNILSIVNAPANGSAIPKNNKVIIYTPNPNWHGTDQYRYEICSNNDINICSQANVTISVNAVNDSPDAVDDAATTNQDVTVTIAVLDNDSDIEGEVVYLHDFDQASQQGGDLQRDDNGTPFLQSDDSIVYSPPTGYFGTDFFNYIASDGSAQSSAQVTVTIIPGEVPDTQAPSVTWLSPVSDEEVYYVSNEMVILEIQVSEDQEIDRVEYHRWDVPTQAYVQLATLSDAPYRFELDTRTINLGWNQINARAYDSAGNASEVGHIWLFKVIQIFLPLAGR